MLLKVATSFIFIEKRTMIQNFPENVQKIWNEWEIRVMVLLSLCLQIVLIIFGNRRKYIVKNWIRLLIWIAYLSADWVATVSLGIISRSQTNSCDRSSGPNSAIMAFWAPFLLVHLGGPDTITAYSLEDNELWLRHFLGLLIQVGVAFYIFVHSWSSNALTFLAIPMFIPGIFKYGERTWVLWSASSKRFRQSLLPPPEAGPDYAEFMEEYSRRVAQGLNVVSHGVIEPPYLRTVPDSIIPEAKLLHEAYFLFNIFKSLYADLILSFHERNHGRFVLQGKTPEDAFKVIEIELGIMYDVLYTKASIAHSPTGMFLRSLSFLSPTCVFVAFWMAVDKSTYSDTDVAITYLLLVGAIFIEIYAGIMLVFSERTLLCLSEQKKGMGNFIYRVISSIPAASVNHGRRWSGSMAQYNLIGFCLKDKPAKSEGILKFFRIYKTMEKFQYKTWEKVTVDLKELIYHKLRLSPARDEPSEDDEPSQPSEDEEPSEDDEPSQPSQDEETSEDDELSKDLSQLLHERGEYVLEKKSCLDKFGWSVVEVEFDHSILLWHIATDLCYYSDINRYQNNSPTSKCEISKSLSDYMLYLLVMCPLMLPKGIGEIRYRDTCAEAIRFIQQRRESISGSRSEACRLLLQVNMYLEPRMVKGDRSKSVLFYGCKLAKSLQALETEEHWENEDKWDMMTQVWIEMLFYAAIHCNWNRHGQQLTQGGELLTHVCLLMAHGGLSEQFQISRGNARMSFF